MAHYAIPIFYHIMLDESVIMLRRITIVLVALVHVDYNQLPKNNFLQHYNIIQQHNSIATQRLMGRYREKREKSHSLLYCSIKDAST